MKSHPGRKRFEIPAALCRPTVPSAGRDARLYGRQDACRHTRAAVEKIHFEGAQYRRDIAAKAL